MTFDRRSYLKATVLAGGGVLGLGETITVASQSQAAPRGRACPPGTTTLARYSVDDGSFSLERGADVVSFSELTQPVRSFDWTSEELVATASVLTGPDRRRFEGGFTGSVDLDDGGPPIREVSFCEPRGGRAVLCELDRMVRSVEQLENGLTSTYDVDFHLSGDPAADESESERDGVVRVASTQETSDYAHGMVNVASRIDERVALDAVTRLSYDFFEGEDNDGAMPDEVFLTVLTDEDQLQMAVTTLNDSDAKFWEPVGDSGWQRLNVANVIRDGEWNVENVDFTDIVTSRGAIETAQRLRSSPDIASVPGTELGDVTLVGVGFGAGNTMERTGIERYFDEVVLKWDGDANGDGASEERFEFPALLPLSVDSVTRRGQGQVVATLSLQQAARGVELSDVVDDSVKLNAYGPFAPPSEPGAAPQTLRADGDSLVVQFRRRDVDEVIDDGRFIVSGDVESQAGYAFVAIGEL